MAVMVLLSVGLGWFGWKLREAERQRGAVEGIREAGGRVVYDYELDEDGSRTRTVEPAAPAWLREMVGVDFFSQVIGIKFTDPRKAGDVDLEAVLEHVNGLTSLSRLELSLSYVTDAGLQHLRGLTRLRRLELAATQVTDVGLKDLKELTDLETLDLSFTEVTNAGLEHLKPLTKLNELWLLQSNVTKDGIEQLQTALPSCDIHADLRWQEYLDQP